MYRPIRNTLLAIAAFMLAYSCSHADTRNGVTRTPGKTPDGVDVVSYGYCDTLAQIGGSSYAVNLKSYSDEGADGTLDLAVTTPAVVSGRKVYPSPWISFRLSDSAASESSGECFDSKTGEYLGLQFDVRRGSGPGRELQEQFEEVKALYDE